MTARGPMILGLVLILVGSAVPAGAQKVAVLLSRTAEPYTQALRGLQREAVFEIQTFNMEGDLDQGRRIIQDLSPQVCTGVVAIGSEATLAAQDLNPQVPLVYTMVLDPEKFEKRSAAGITIKLAISDQLGRIQHLFPKRKRIGVLFDPQHSGADIEEAHRWVDKLGLTLVALSVEHQEEIPAALQRLTPDVVDLLWTVVDPTVVNPVAIQQLILHSLKKSIPLIGLSVYHVKAGALAAFSADFFDIGEQTADRMQRWNHGDVRNEIETPRKVLVYINARVQKQMGVGPLPDAPEILYIR